MRYSKLISVALWVFAFYLYAWHPASTHLVDFSVYWEAGQRITHHRSIYAANYEVLTHTGEIFRPPFSYPPTLAALVSFFSFLEKSTAQFAWCIGAWVAALVSALFLARSMTLLKLGDLPKTFLGCSFGLICFEPVYWGIRMGQVDVFILVLLSIGAYYFLLATTEAAGFFVGWAAAIKMSPALVLLPVIRGQKRQAIVGIVLALTCAASMILGTGTLQSDLMLFLTNFSNLASGKVDSEFITNFAMYRPLLTLFGLSSSTIAAWGLKCGLLALFVLLAFCLRLQTNHQRLTAFGFTICWMIALPPTVHFQHLMWALVPLTALAVSIKDMRGAFWAAAIYFALDQSNLIMYSVIDKLPSAIAAAQLFPAVVLAILAAWLWRVNRSEIL